MAKPLPDLGAYNEEETLALAVHALSELTPAKRREAVFKSFDSEGRDELAAWLDNGEEGDDK